MPNTKLKILEICPFSAGICGVWTRVLSESKEFVKKGFEVRVFSSDIVKGSNEKASCTQTIGDLNIIRFKSSRSLLSSNVNNFNFEKELLDYDPDIVITHLLHPHSFKALKICRKKNIPCYLVTHAPFNVKRNFLLNMATSFYNLIRIIPNINRFTKIIAITKWEMPYLSKLGVEKDKIIYIPNGIPEEFLTQKKCQTNNDILFLGRIAPVKNLELLLDLAKKMPKLNISLVGGAEDLYLKKIMKIIKEQKITNVVLLPPVYDLSAKIKLIDEHKLFILPSLREAMPQVILEAMARGKLVLASKTDGAKEIILDKKTGFLFNIGDSQELAKLIIQNLNGNSKIQKNAEKDSKKYAWSKLIKQYPFVKIR